MSGHTQAHSRLSAGESLGCRSCPLGDSSVQVCQFLVEPTTAEPTVLQLLRKSVSSEIDSEIALRSSRAVSVALKFCQPETFSSDTPDVYEAECTGRPNPSRARNLSLGDEG